MSKWPPRFGRLTKGGQKWIRNAKRCAIYERDGWRCAYGIACARLTGQRLELDHVTPHGMGGTNRADNLVTTCAACNESKGARSLELWLDDYPLGLAVSVGHRVLTLLDTPIDLTRGKAIERARVRGSFARPVGIAEPHAADQTPQ